MALLRGGGWSDPKREVAEVEAEEEDAEEEYHEAEDAEEENRAVSFDAKGGEDTDDDDEISSTFDSLSLEPAPEPADLTPR